MWLLPAFSAFARNALKIFYRLTLAGERVPARGPVLLVANHPNSLVDPAMVAAVARRPVRFLAKAPLFAMPGIGVLVKGAGAIPVYRAQDNAGPTDQNQDTFRAVWAALAEGAAVGIFPEGTSHSAPSLVPLKTGAARIALGAAARTGGAFPILPVGLSFRDKAIFRSAALAVVGDSVEWDDLAHAGPDDREVVRALTARIDEALRDVTVNLERWEDEELVHAAEAIYAAELPVDDAPDARVTRLVEATEGLARVRAEGRAEWRRVAREVAGHARILGVLGITPAQLHGSPRVDVAAGWTLRQLLFFGVGAPVAALGIAVYWIPYRLTGVLEQWRVKHQDVRATFKVLVGGVLHLLWTIAIAAAVGWRFGVGPALCVLVGLPLAGFVAIHVTEQWKRSVAEARRFFLRARRRTELRELRARQRELAAKLHALWEELARAQ
ncbi:MAG: 1-acyl-sn-glycerol-3-phosphate acyltransferase [Longimicrobiaceae bacterium]